jgi:hypothetical protein
MAEYYFVGTVLPPLSFDVPPEISFASLDTLLRDNLTAKDYEKTLVIRRFFDILNLRSFWLGEELDPRGALSELDLEEALLSRVGLPSYVYEFVDKYPKQEDRLHHFPFILARFFQSAQEIQDPFLVRYLNFERELRLVMTAFRAKKLGRDLSVELQYENPEEDLIAQLLAQQDAKVYEPPEKYKDLKVLFEKYGDDPLALQRALDEYRVEKIEGLVDMSDLFSIDRILAYFLQFIIVERWFHLDQAKGIQIIDTIVKNHIKT